MMPITCTVIVLPAIDLRCMSSTRVLPVSATKFEREPNWKRSIWSISVSGSKLSFKSAGKPCAISNCSPITGRMFATSQMMWFRRMQGSRSVWFLLTAYVTLGLMSQKKRGGFRNECWRPRLPSSLPNYNRAHGVLTYISQRHQDKGPAHHHSPQAPGFTGKVDVGISPC
jgi:hypothetical protein